MSSVRLQRPLVNTIRARQSCDKDNSKFNAVSTQDPHHVDRVRSMFLEESEDSDFMYGWIQMRAQMLLFRTKTILTVALKKILM